MKIQKLISQLIFIAPTFAGGALCFPAFAEEKTDTLPDVEVVAATQSRDITSLAPTHTLSSEMMLQTGVADMSDALRRLPGINLKDYGGAGGLKTVSVRGLGAAHTAVSYDGVTLSDVRSGEIDLSRYTLDNLASLSLTAGDNSDIFIPARNAASASLLTINTVRNPDLWDKAVELTASMRAGSFGLYNPYVHVGYSNGSDFSISATADFLHASNDYPFTLVNGRFTSRERRSNSRMNSAHGEVNAIWTPSPGSSLGAKIYYYNNRRHLPGPVIYYLEETNEALHDRNFFGQLRYQNKLSSIFSILSLAKFNWSSSRYTDKNGRYPGGLLDNYYIQREMYATAALLCIPFQNFLVDYSADWFLNNLTENLPNSVHPVRNSILQSLTAKYSFRGLDVMARAIFSIFDDHTRDSQTDRTLTRLSPSFSISWQPVFSLPFYMRASYKNIYRMPTFNELYFDNYGSLNLDPEITDQFNLGFTFSSPPVSFLKSLEITADGYINNVRNKIVAIPYNLFKWTMTNLGKVRVFGADITLNAEFTITSSQSILVTANYSYQRAQPRTSPDRSDWMKQVAYTPLNSGAGSLSWLNPWVSVALNMSGTSARYTTNNNLPSTRMAGYADFGASLFHNFNFRGHQLELKGSLLNIFDKQYEVVARYPMPGRSWQVSLKFEL